MTHLLKRLPVIDGVNNAYNIRLQRQTDVYKSAPRGQTSVQLMYLNLQIIPWRSPDKAAHLSVQLLYTFKTQLFTLRSYHVTGSAFNLLVHYLSSPLYV